MSNQRHVLLVRTDLHQGTDYIALRDYILESLALGALVLRQDDSIGIMELPPLGELNGIEVQVETQTPEAVPNEAEEKRAILARLKDYRKSNGLGALEKLSIRTAHQKKQRISVDTLRYLCADGAPKMPLSDWRKIAKALDKLEGREENDHVSEDHPI